MKPEQAFAAILISLVVLLALSLGAKWLIFDTLLEPDETGRQRISPD